MFPPGAAYRIVGYLGEEAVYSDTVCLAGVDNGNYPSVPAPQVAIDYWKLAPGTLLRDVIVVIRAHEARHPDVNHQLADELTRAQD